VAVRWLAQVNNLVLFSDFHQISYMAESGVVSDLMKGKLFALLIFPVCCASSFVNYMNLNVVVCISSGE
jgi:hypothetical protein